MLHLDSRWDVGDKKKRCGEGREGGGEESLSLKPCLSVGYNLRHEDIVSARGGRGVVLLGSGRGIKLKFSAGPGDLGKLVFKQGLETT